MSWPKIARSLRGGPRYFGHGMIGTTLIALAGEPLMILELTAR